MNSGCVLVPAEAACATTHTHTVQHHSFEPHFNLVLNIIMALCNFMAASLCGNTSTAWCNYLCQNKCTQWYTIYSTMAIELISFNRANLSLAHWVMEAIKAAATNERIIAALKTFNYYWPVCGLDGHWLIGHCNQHLQVVPIVCPNRPHQTINCRSSLVHLVSVLVVMVALVVVV